MQVGKNSSGDFFLVKMSYFWNINLLCLCTSFSFQCTQALFNLQFFGVLRGHVFISHSVFHCGMSFMLRLCVSAITRPMFCRISLLLSRCLIRIFCQRGMRIREYSVNVEDEFSCIDTSQSEMQRMLSQRRMRLSIQN
jgi:hypothetical protein